MDNLSLILGNAINININNNSLIYYARIGKLEVVNKLLDSPKIDVNAQNRYNNTALIYASRHGYSNIVQKLLECKADCNIQGENELTALMWASRKNHLDIAQLLLQNQALYYLQDDQNMTALNWASDIKCSLCIGKTRLLISLLKKYEGDHIRESIISVSPFIYRELVDLIIQFILE